MSQFISNFMYKKNLRGEQRITVVVENKKTQNVARSHIMAVNNNIKKKNRHHNKKVKIK